VCAPVTNIVNLYFTNTISITASEIFSLFRLELTSLINRAAEDDRQRSARAGSHAQRTTAEKSVRMQKIPHEICNATAIGEPITIAYGRLPKYREL